MKNAHTNRLNLRKHVHVALFSVLVGGGAALLAHPASNAAASPAPSDIVMPLATLANSAGAETLRLPAQRLRVRWEFTSVNKPLRPILVAGQLVIANAFGEACMLNFSSQRRQLVAAVPRNILALRALGTGSFALASTSPPQLTIVDDGRIAASTPLLSAPLANGLLEYAEGQLAIVAERGVSFADRRGQIRSTTELVVDASAPFSVRRASDIAGGVLLLSKRGELVAVNPSGAVTLRRGARAVGAAAGVWDAGAAGIVGQDNAGPILLWPTRRGLAIHDDAAVLAAPQVAGDNVSWLQERFIGVEWVQRKIGESTEAPQRVLLAAGSGLAGLPLGGLATSGLAPALSPTGSTFSPAAASVRPLGTSAPRPPFPVPSGFPAAAGGSSGAAPNAVRGAAFLRDGAGTLAYLLPDGSGGIVTANGQRTALPLNLCGLNTASAQLIAAGDGMLAVVCSDGHGVLLGE